MQQQYTVRTFDLGVAKKAYEILWQNPNIFSDVLDGCFPYYMVIPWCIQEHPTSCSAEKLFYSGYFAGKIDPVLCAAGKMKYICWETFFCKLFC